MKILVRHFERFAIRARELMASIPNGGPLAKKMLDERNRLMRDVHAEALRVAEVAKAFSKAAS